MVFHEKVSRPAPNSVTQVPFLEATIVLWLQCKYCVLCISSHWILKRYILNYHWEVVQDGSVGRHWTPLLPDRANQQLQMKAFPLKKTWKLTQQLFCNRDRISHKTPPLVWWPALGKDITNMEFFLGGARSLCPKSGTPTLGTYTREMSPQNAWLWKPVGLIHRRTVQW